MSGIVQQQPCQYIIILPHHPKNSMTQVNLASSVTVQGCTHMLIHSIWMCSNMYIQYWCEEEVSGILQPPPCQHIIISSHHPQIPDYPNLLGSTRPVQQCKGAPICLSTAYECAQTLSIYTIWMCRRSEQYSKASKMSMHCYLWYGASQCAAKIVNVTFYEFCRVQKPRPLYYF